MRARAAWKSGDQPIESQPSTSAPCSTSAEAIAAQRAGVTHLVFPKANERDWNELPDNLREGLTAHFAGHYSDVYEVAFPADAK